MASGYPATLDTFATNKQDDTDSKAGTDLGVSTTVGDHSQHHNDLADALNKIETELGTTPKGPYATNVRNRFEILDWKRSCRAAAVANVAGTYATGPPATKAVGGTSLTVDGVAVANGDRVFLPCQTTAAENGIYLVSGVGTSIVLTRTYDADESAKMTDSCYVSVEQGAVHKDTTWELLTDNPITLGTTALYYTRVTPSHTYSQRNWFTPGGTMTSGNPMPATAPVIAETMTRREAHDAVGLGTAAAHVLAALVVPGGRTITTLNFMYSTAPGTITTFWVALLQASDRVVKAVSANATGAWAAAPAIKSVNVGSTFTPVADTMMYVGIATQVATTAPIVAGITLGATGYSTLAPAANGTTTAPTATPPTTGTALAALTASANVPYIWLT